MQDRSAVGHRLVDGEHVREHLIGDLDGGRSRLCLLAGDRSHRSHDVAFVVDPISGDDVVRHHHIVWAGAPLGEVGEVGAGDDGLDPRHRLGGAGVDRGDRGVSVG